MIYHRLYVDLEGHSVYTSHDCWYLIALNKLIYKIDSYNVIKLGKWSHKTIDYVDGESQHFFYFSDKQPTLCFINKNNNDFIVCLSDCNPCDEFGELVDLLYPNASFILANKKTKKIIPFKMKKEVLDAVPSHDGNTALIVHRASIAILDLQ